MPWFLILIFIILCIILLIVSFTSQSSYTSGTSYTTEVPTCSISYETSIDVTDLPNCSIGGYLTASKYVEQLNMTVNPIQTYYLNVCAQYCSSGFDESSCINGNGQQDFDNCIAISMPNGCDGLSMPVAISGTTFYYPYGAGNICDVLE